VCFDYVTGVGFDSVICVTGVDCAGFFWGSWFVSVVSMREFFSCDLLSA